MGGAASFYQPYPIIGGGSIASDFNHNHQQQHQHFNNICPTSSTSTGSNNSMQSSLSVSESSSALDGGDLRPPFSRQQHQNRG